MKINKIKCDQCGAERDTQQVGGWPMISANVGTKLLYRTPHDFCDEKCLLAWLLAQPMAANPPNAEFRNAADGAPDCKQDAQ